MAELIAGDRRIDMAEVNRRAAQAATGFLRLGLGDTDAIALYLRNDVAFFEASLAAGLIGAYATPINWHFTADEAGYILRDCGARALLVHADLWPAIAEAVPEGVAVFVVPTPPEIRAAYRLADVPVAPGMTEWDRWVDTHEPLTGVAPPPRASMIYTSGTTGRPKGVRRQRPSPEQAARQIEFGGRTYGLKPDGRTVALMNGPMYHSAPNAYAMLAARTGAGIVLQPRFDPEEMLALIERHRITHMHIVPTMFVRLLKLPDEVKRRYDLSSLRWVIHGAAPCPPAVKRAMIEWWGPVINEYYGATETGITVWHSSAEALERPGTVGRVMDFAEVRVLDEAGRVLPPGSIGEIYMRVHDLPDFTYQGADDKRREVGHEHLVTVGDVGWMDEDGYVFLCDRKRDMVISGGVNIYPAEIESVLIGMPGVRDCAVFGIPDEEFGESLCAYVEPDDSGAPPTREAVRAFLAERLAKFKLPRVVEIAASLPREDSGKIFKRKLRTPYWEAAGRNI